MDNFNIIPRINDYLQKQTKLPFQAGGRRLLNNDNFEEPTVSIITIVKNSQATLSQTIESVLNQKYKKFEYIIIDGASTDGSLEIIRSLERNVDYWISEPDLGPADAANKGISFSKGDYVFFVYSDDWVDPNHVLFGIETLEKTGADFVFGDLIYYKNNYPIFLLKGEQNYTKEIKYKMPIINFPTMIIRRNCFETLGLFNLTYKVAPDYEWLLRLHNAGGRGIYDNRLIGHFRLGGTSSKFYLQGLKEVRKASIQNGLSPFIANKEFIIRLCLGTLRRISENLLPKFLFQKIFKIFRKNTVLLERNL